jgi:putative RecB family exonuclease
MSIGKLPDHVSYSQLSTYLQCPLKYRFHYIDGLEPEFTSASLAFGQCVHEAVAGFFQSALEGEHLSADNMIDIYRESWRGCDGPTIKYDRGGSEEKLLKLATDVLTLWHSNQDPAVEVLGVEEPFTVDLGEKVDYPGDGLPPLVGYVDHILKMPDGNITLIDLKTAARKPSQAQADQTLQLTAYSLGAEELGFNADELTLRLDYLIKTATPDLVTLETSRTEDDKRKFTKLLTRVWKGIETSIFYPNQGYLCGSCGYQSHCKEW